MWQTCWRRAANSGVEGAIEKRPIARRNRKTRHRKLHFNNRVNSKHKGWLAPSIENKIQTNIKTVDKVHMILPITKIAVETASFAIQKTKNPDISGDEYQQGDQMGFWNAREYVLLRDGHACHGRKNCKNPILNVHHIETRKIGGDAPNNLICIMRGLPQRLPGCRFHGHRGAAFGTMRVS
jgi:N6-L-threonylcarbamoyladenine synthase